MKTSGLHVDTGEPSVIDIQTQTVVLEILTETMAYFHYVLNDINKAVNIGMFVWLSS